MGAANAFADDDAVRDPSLLTPFQWQQSVGIAFIKESSASRCVKNQCNETDRVGLSPTTNEEESVGNLQHQCSWVGA